MNDILALTAAAAFVSLCGVAVSAGRLVRRVRADYRLTEGTAGKLPGPPHPAQGGLTSRVTEQKRVFLVKLSQLLRERDAQLQLTQERLAARQEEMAKELQEAIQILVRQRED